MAVERDAYAVLHVAPDAPLEVISAAYRTLARRSHPDGPTPDPLRILELNRAYNQLKTPELRAVYDASRSVIGSGAGQSAAPAHAASPTSVSTPLARRFAAAASASQGGASQAGEPQDAAVDFGRYAGWRISDLARHDPDYLRWLSRHSSGIRFREAIARSLPGDKEIGGRANTRR